MANENGTIVKDGGTYSYTTTDDYLNHECTEWEDDTEGKFPQPKPSLEYEIDITNMRYKIKCSHCLILLTDTPLSGG